MLESLSLLNLIISIALVVGGILAYRYGFAKTANEVQERVINALQNEIQALRERINMLEQENTRLNQTVTTICSALKQRGTHLTIDGDIISIRERSDYGRTYSARIFGGEESDAQNGDGSESVAGKKAATKAGVRRRSKKYGLPVGETEEEEKH